MNSRERIQLAINHEEPDRVPLDLGATPTTGMHVSSVYLLRQALKLDPPETPVKVIEPYQMMGEIQPDLMDALGVDAISLWRRNNMFGFRNENWKPWTLFDGTPLLVPEAFNTQPEADGSILMYPEGDHNASPSGRMPKDGFYFDCLLRPTLPDDYEMDIRENTEEFQPIPQEELDYIGREAERLFTQTDKAILANIGGTALGDISQVSAPWMKSPSGIRNLEDWYMSTISRREYVLKIYEHQCEIGIENFARLHKAVENRITAIFMSGTDFGAQRGSFISNKTYREMYLPFQKRMNDWVHKNTTWKCFLHSCGSIVALMPDLIEAGFDIFNPVQTSAAGMDPSVLKERFGEQVTFWGGGVDTQRTLPFGTPEQIRAEVKERIRIFGSGGGFVFNPSHNIQAGIPVKNLLALFQAVKDFGSY